MENMVVEMDAMTSKHIRAADISDDENKKSIRERKGRRMAKQNGRKSLTDVTRSRFTHAENGIENGNDDDVDDSDEEVENVRFRPPRPSTAAARKSMAFVTLSSANRRRRRSSVRFLKLNDVSNRISSGGHGDDDNASVVSTATFSKSNSNIEQNLSDLYDKAIRMNAENKINAGNSWNLRLIENIDKFLELVLEEDAEDDDEEESGIYGTESNVLSGPTSQTPKGQTNNDGSLNSLKSTTKRRVNFTKASCTLDTSVKIYSYRVDDVHLTSYKVLANLNRTDNNKLNKNKVTGIDQSATMNADETGSPNFENNNQRSKSLKTAKNHGNTIEAHLGKYAASYNFHSQVPKFPF